MASSRRPTGAGRASSGASAPRRCSCSSGCSSSGSGRCSGSPSRRSRRRPTRSATRCRCFPNGAAWSNLQRGVDEVEVGRYFWNTVVLAFGSWLTQIVVATTGGFVLSVLRPRYAGIVKALLLLTLFVPAVVLLVPLYIEIVNPPLIDHSFIDSYWAIWLPAGASAFNVILVTRFFDNLPREVFEAARIDGAGPFRLFFSVALPMSTADPRRRLGLRRARFVEGLPLAAARSHESRQATSLRSPADDPVADGARRLPCGDVHRVPRPHRRRS